MFVFSTKSTENSTILRKNRKNKRGTGAIVASAPLFALALRVRGASNRPSARSLRNSAPRCGAFGCAPIAKLRAVRCARSQQKCALSLRGTWFAKRSLWFCAVSLRLVACVLLCARAKAQNRRLRKQLPLRFVASASFGWLVR